ncbi:MAG: methionine--tRNA ligase [Nitrospirae bacterium]|nr:MAG: methionine--tRNA ligase [Nitrospirota bacterium]
MEKFYVTTPIYYVNDVPHIGHAYTTVAADILARFNRLCGKAVFFLTGTDEHGQKVQKAAQERGLSPKEHADRMVVNFQNLWKRLNISNDAFIRTTDEEHKRVVQEILMKLYEKGEIVKRPYRGWYCTPDERFWTDKEIENGRCPDCGRPVEEIEEDNYFFLMSKYQDALIDYIEKNPNYILPETRKNEVMGFLRANPLGDLCISRPKKRLSWGVELPFDPDYVTYVWFDALVNYYSATRYLAPRYSEPVNWWPANHHIVGKDILTTHAVYWSTMLMALGMALPENIFAHGWWTVEGRKMSKSLGNVVDPFEVVDTYGADAFRYFLFREVTFGLDGDFSEDAIVGRINSELANDLGNLLSRTVSMARKYFDNTIPEPEGKEDELAQLAEGALKRIEGHLRVLAYHRALDEIWSLVDYINKYIDRNQPWALAKEPEKQGRLKTVIYSALEGLRFIALYLYPFMPESAERILKGLGIDEPVKEGAYRNLSWGGLKPGIHLSKAKPLFPRIEKKKKEDKDKVQEEKTKDNLISIDEFARVELKVAKVLEAERIEGSSKLIKLQVDAGEKRQIVAGIGKAYSPEELVGKYVVVVSNLKPAKLMGVESQGMLLAAGGEKSLSIVTLEKEIAPGTRVK